MGRYLDARRARARELYKPPGESSVVLRYRRTPRCGREQFVARIAYAGICGTDVQILRGERGCEPGVLGHECVARVVDVGADVPGIATGQVIGVNPNHPRDDHDKLGHNLPGVLRDFAVWDGHLVDREQIVTLPGQARAEWVLMEPLACALRSVRVGMPARGWAGRRVLVVGAGVMGLLHALLLRRLGAERVLLANRGAYRPEVAVRRGVLPADDCLPLDGHLAQSVRQATGGYGIDAAFVAVSGTAGPAIVESLWTSLADGSVVDMFSGFAPDAAVRLPGGDRVAVQPVRRGAFVPVPLPGGGRCRLVGSRGASGQECREARDLCVDPAGLDLAPLVSHIVSMEAAPTVLDELATDGRVGGEPALRVVVDLGLTGHVVRPVDGTDLPRLGGS
jgi:threonine dehydrogenase-like Zn-dependent dehydrogenase